MNIAYDIGLQNKRVAYIHKVYELRLAMISVEIDELISKQLATSKQIRLILIMYILVREDLCYANVFVFVPYGSNERFLRHDSVNLILRINIRIYICMCAQLSLVYMTFWIFMTSKWLLMMQKLLCFNTCNLRHLIWYMNKWLLSVKYYILCYITRSWVPLIQ